MLDIFKRPIVVIIIVAAIVIALVWSYASKLISDRKNQQNSNQNTSISDLTTIDPKEFDAVSQAEFEKANGMAILHDPKQQLAAIEIELPSLALNSGNTRYVFISESDTANNWTVTFSQQTGNFIRADIPKSDYLGSLSPINLTLWKFNYVTALQIAESEGGLKWREENGFGQAKLTLRHNGANNWLVWLVEYVSGDQTFSKIIDANSGKIVEE